MAEDVELMAIKVWLLQLEIGVTLEALEYYLAKVQAAGDTKKAELIQGAIETLEIANRAY